MNEHERRRRAVAAQGFAALALFVFAHGARAATLPARNRPRSETSVSASDTSGLNTTGRLPATCRAALRSRWPG